MESRDEVDLAKGSEGPAALEYLTGFDNEHESEALPGALPLGQRSPQRPAYDLYAEQLSGTSFTAPRADNRRTWLYRIRPSAKHGKYALAPNKLLRSGPINEVQTPAAQLRWDAFPIPGQAGDFVDGLTTLAANGDVRMQAGIGIHLYLARRSMTDRFFFNADGELLIVPQQGRLRLHTECGVLDAAPGEIAIVPRGMVFRVVLLDGASSGYVCENYGQAFRLPERGPVGSDGFANQRDFMAPVAAFEDREGEFELTSKFCGQLFSCRIDHSPLDVVAWWGNHVPYRYDLARFNTIGTISYDHPDPSVFTVLTSPSDTPGVANADFVIFPPRWAVATDTFRPPPFHRNTMSEFMGLIHGVYEARPEGFLPGGSSLHNCMLPHGPTAEVHGQASRAELEPIYMADTLAFMFESRYVIQPTRFAMEAAELQRDYADCWQSLRKNFKPEPPR
jgi:homogentisate 1,2-dioxygenase